MGGGCDLGGVQSSSMSKGFARRGGLERDFAGGGGRAGLVKVGGEDLVVRLRDEAPISRLGVLLIFDGADLVALRGGFAGGRRVSRSSLSLSDVVRATDCCFAEVPRILLEAAYDGVVVGTRDVWVESEARCSSAPSSS